MNLNKTLKLWSKKSIRFVINSIFIITLILFVFFRQILLVAKFLIVGLVFLDFYHDVMNIRQLRPSIHR